MDTHTPTRDVHAWFGLTYANYLVIPRTVLQSMPEDWQVEFVRLLDEYDEAMWDADISLPDYRVQPVDNDGRFMRDPIPHYDRGRARIGGLARS